MRWMDMSECVQLRCSVAEKGATIMWHDRSDRLHETIFRSRLMRVINQQWKWHSKVRRFILLF